MMKAFNWGHGLAIFYIIFVGTLITVLIASFKVDHTLVADDYYAKDLAYQKQYDETRNALQHEKVSISQDMSTGILTIQLPNETSIKGNVQFYRPSDKSLDFDMNINNPTTTISTDKLIKGKWILKISWTQDGIDNYFEDILIL